MESNDRRKPGQLNQPAQKGPVRKAGPTFGGIREKLIGIFVIIKVLPLIALALFAARQIDILGGTVWDKSEEMAGDTRDLVTQVGGLATESSIRALDLKSRESIERLATDTAQAVAKFLYERDGDVLIAAGLPVDEKSYSRFIALRRRPVDYHQPWVLSEDKSGWVAGEVGADSEPGVTATLSDNEKDFHYRPPSQVAATRVQPLYHEMTFVDLSGQEIIKISATGLLGEGLHDISDRRNTWCGAETYFGDLTQLQEGEIYVSQVIGPYVPSPIIGPYTPERAKARNIPFAPEAAGYAGKENPVGKRFQGIIRWASPVFKNGAKVGYVTLALDHTHLAEFTDHIVPTEERYSAISDAGSGNYAFMWDYEGRNISHPRDYFIVGYDPATGEQAVPWLSAELYDLWLTSGESFARFEETAPQFKEQSLKKKPAKPLTDAGMVGLDCRYLNFAPQCKGWDNLTQFGGSGSFVIFWSKLWKLTTAAAIPYHTGMYQESSRGFGFVTIGANVDEFHSSATETAARISAITREYETSLDKKTQSTLSLIDKLLGKTIEDLTLSTAVLVVLVIMIAIWMASVLSRKITVIIQGIKHFQAGSLSSRLQVGSRDEIGQLAVAFNEMSDTIEESVEEIRKERDRAEESDRAKSLFLANMSHEIRTPMNAIIGMSRLAIEASETPEQHKLLESVKTSADSLLAIINDILDFSKIEAGQLDLENHTFSLHSLVRSTIRSVSVLAGEKGIEVDHTIADNVPDLVRGDNMRVRQVLLNLLGNGVKFTSEGAVHLAITAGNQVENSVETCFEVVDSGIGIEPEHLETIFDRFSQSDLSNTRKHQGSGLGLAISRKLCRLMGGDVSVESEPGRGSTFRFSVIFAEPEPASGMMSNEEDDPTQSSLQPLSILLVEDNYTNRELARLVLEQGGHKVASCESGITALKALAEASFDIVLMDIQMPEMDGLTATRIIRSCETNSVLCHTIPDGLESRLRERLQGGHQPIVALTAHAMRGDKEKCLEAGTDDYLTKPFLPLQVISVLRRHVNNSRSRVQNNMENEQMLDAGIRESLTQVVKGNLSRAYGLEESQIDHLVQTAISNIKEEFSKLEQALGIENTGELKSVAHSLKGILLNLRLKEQAAIAEKLQHLDAGQQGVEAPQLMKRLRSTLHEFVG
ncbi:MAG: ATP-binding protein [Desulforhopalus sp.]